MVIRQGEIGSIGQALCLFPENHAARYTRQSGFENIPELRKIMPALLDFKAGQLCRLAESNDAGNILGATAAVMFLLATRDQGITGLALYHQRPYSLGAAQVVCAEKLIASTIQFRQVQVQLAYRLGGIAVTPGSYRDRPWPPILLPAG